MTDAEKYCAGLDSYFANSHVRDYLKARHPEIEKQLAPLRLLISKSCLLDRLIHGGEAPSSMPCPVHKGHWSGIHLGWPGQRWSNGTPVEESAQCREWFDAGCRCFQHYCGCTTGWQP